MSDFMLIVSFVGGAILLIGLAILPALYDAVDGFSFMKRKKIKKKLAYFKNSVYLCHIKLKRKELIMITEDRVPFEIAKLLEKKGFKGEFKDYYDCNGFYFETPNIVLKESGYSYYPIPSLSVVLKWLREVHGIFIEITCCVNDKYDFYVGVFIKGNECWDRCNYYPEGFETFEEACNTGIEYTLENLI